MQARFRLSTLLLASLAALLLAAGCATSSHRRSDSDLSSDQLQIQQRLGQIFDAAEKKDLERLDSYHLYGPHFTKFSSGVPARQDASAARQGEHDGLAALNHLTMRADDLKIDVFDDVGIATFLFTVSFESGGRAIQKQDHGTLVLVKEGGSWKIVHEHFSSLPPKP